jgi:hypothetical protein
MIKVSIEIFMLVLGIIVIAFTYYLNVLLWGLIITSALLIIYLLMRLFQNLKAKEKYETK